LTLNQYFPHNPYVASKKGEPNFSLFMLKGKKRKISF
jgi:hypothetical protein